jgi:hypothetical protein
MAAPGIVRRLRAIERDKVRDHLLRLDAEDRLRRFAGYLSDAQIETYCANLDWGRALIVAARNRFIARLHMICLMDNARVQHLARKLDGRLAFEQGEVEARIEPPWPTYWTLLEETLDATPVPAPMPHPPLG